MAISRDTFESMSYALHLVHEWYPLIDLEISQVAVKGLFVSSDTWSKTLLRKILESRTKGPETDPTHFSMKSTSLEACKNLE